MLFLPEKGTHKVKVDQTLQSSLLEPTEKAFLLLDNRYARADCENCKFEFCTRKICENWIMKRV